jgi:hypothetical protein
VRGARSTKCTVDEIVFDSIAEACFYCWCKEAKELGVLEEYECQPAYSLLEPAYRYETVQLKTKTKEVQRTLLQGADYTADYRLYSVNPIPGLLEPKAWFHEESGAYYAPYAEDLVAHEQGLC